PLVLGLRRTLAFQLVEAAQARDPFPRAAVLAVEALGLALAVNLLLRRLAGIPRGVPAESPVVRAEVASWARAAGVVRMPGAGAFLAWLPAVALLQVALTTGGPPPAAALRRVLADPEVRRMIAMSAVVGLAVVAIDVGVARAVAAWNRRRRGARTLLAWL